MKRLIDADALIAECGSFMSVPRSIDPDVLLENGGDLTSICYPETVKDIIEKQPMIICKTIEDKKIHPIDILDTIDNCDLINHIKEDLAEEIGRIMMKKGMIAFYENQDIDEMVFKVMATANVVTQMPKEDEQDG